MSGISYENWAKDYVKVRRDRPAEPGFLALFFGGDAADSVSRYRLPRFTSWRSTPNERRQRRSRTATISSTSVSPWNPTRAHINGVLASRSVSPPPAMASRPRNNVATVARQRKNDDNGEQVHDPFPPIVV